METHDSTVPYYLESKTKSFMSDFRDVSDIFDCSGETIDDNRDHILIVYQISN